MIVTEKKPIEELLEMLNDAKRVAIVGCGSCAAACKTGGEPEADELAQLLTEYGISAVAKIIPDETCHKMLVKKDLKVIRELSPAPDAVICMSCGDGVQTVAELVSVPVYPSNNTKFLGQTERIGIFHEMCRMCGDCVLGSTGGICPITHCAKSLVNGPCGGQKNGRCEVNPENACGWILIYDRLKELNQLDKLMRIRPDKGFAAHTHPQNINLRAAGTDKKTAGNKLKEGSGLSVSQAAIVGDVREAAL